MVDNIPSKTYCPLPFSHLFVEATGEVKACCIADSFSPSLNVNKESLSSLYNSESFKELRKSMEKGEKHKVCKQCWAKEEAGIVSLRQTNLGLDPLECLPKKTILSDNGFVQPKFTSLDIRFSNKCNLKCIMCGPTNSHLHNNGKIIEVKDKFLDELYPLLEEVEDVYFAGGEPLVMDQHYELLSYLAENKPDTKIVYSTNLMVLERGKYKVIDLWKKFNKSPFVSISCDGLYELGEEIRVNFNTSKFIDNVRTLQENNIEYNISCTVGTYNAFNIYNFINQLVNLKLVNDINKDITFFNLVVHPKHYCLSSLDQKKQEELLIYLKGPDSPYNDMPLTIQAGVDNILKYLNLKHT